MNLVSIALFIRSLSLEPSLGFRDSPSRRPLETPEAELGDQASEELAEDADA